MNYDKNTRDHEKLIHITETKPTMQTQGFNLSTLSPSMLAWIEKNCHDVILVLDKDGKMLYISDSAERILGYQPSKLVGKAWYEFVYREDVKYVKENLKQVSSTNQFYEINVLNSEGEYIWSECTLAKLKEEDEKIYYIAIVADIRDKKEAEEFMIQSEKMSVAGQLAAGIAHEIRNPLTSLKGFLQLLQAGVNRKEEYYNIMVEEIEKMETITSELLFISKPLTENKKVQLVESMIHDVIVLLRPQAKMRDIVIEYSASGGEKIYCDRSQIKQVLINLIKNAIEAMENGGKIQVNTSSSDTHVHISVIDEGPGIPEDIINKLGEPFFTTKQSGTGLGLMITKQILERHQAFLEIKANEGAGSTFRIIFPTPA